MSASRAERRIAALMEGRELLLRTLETTDLDVVITQFLSQSDLAELHYHFEQHGADLNCSAIDEYLDQMRRHLAKSHAELYARRRKQGDIMWYAIDPETGEVVQYNQSRDCLWSYYRTSDVEQFVKAPDMVRLDRSTGKWRIERE